MSVGNQWIWSQWVTSKIFYYFKFIVLLAIIKNKIFFFEFVSVEKNANRNRIIFLFFSYITIFLSGSLNRKNEGFVELVAPREENRFPLSINWIKLLNSFHWFDSMVKTFYTNRWCSIFHGDNSLLHMFHLDERINLKSDHPMDFSLDLCRKISIEKRREDDLLRSSISSFPNSYGRFLSEFDSK